MKSNVRKNGQLTIGRLAREANVGLGTVRYYQKMGLLSQPERPALGGFRVYGESDLERLLQIRGAQALGFSLAEIEVLLKGIEQGDCSDVKKLLEKKIMAMRSQIHSLKEIETTLSNLVNGCTGRCEGKCPLKKSICGVRVPE